MPWVRIDENAMEHRKLLVLSAEAFRLWVRGLAHCQKHLTDGLISRADLRTIRGVTRSRVQELVTPIAPDKSPLWEPVDDGFLVHDYLEWNESREHVLKAREFAKQRIKRLRAKKRNGVTNAEHQGEPTLTALSGVECSSSSSEVKERGVGKTMTLPERAGAFTEWYEDTHERLFGIGYMGTNNDWQKALEMCGKFTDSQMQDAALVWFGADDDFATQGTRTIVKFASRITGYLQSIRERGIA